MKTTTAAMVTVAPFSGSNYRRNEEKCNNVDVEACAVCGKACIPGDGSLMAHIIDGGARFETATSGTGSEAGDMGWMPVGTGCAKKLRKQGAIVKVWE
jgi:hypothetical protein